MILRSINLILDEMIALLGQLPDEEYCHNCMELSGATIGEHTRHVIEMFQCLESQYESGIINYDKRERNLLIQTSTSYAIETLKKLKHTLNKNNRPLQLKQQLAGEGITVASNYERELLYNLEHSIHHQALIKVGLLHCKSIRINENFGVAASTIAHRTCAQ